MSTGPHPQSFLHQLDEPSSLETSRLDSLLALGLTRDASIAEIDAAFEIACFTWESGRFPLDSNARRDVEAELGRITAAYRRLRPSDVDQPEAREHTSRASLVCPSCGTSLFPKRVALPGSKVRCGQQACRKVFVVGEVGLPNGADSEAVKPAETDGYFSTRDCEVLFEVEGDPDGLPQEFAILSGFARPTQWWAAAANSVGDAGLRDHIALCGGLPRRIYRVSPDGVSTPSWTATVPIDQARTIAKEHDQAIFYMFKRGAIAIATSGTPHAVLTLGRDRIRSRPQGAIDA
jgi:hypothetical protein